jgi:imidazolonepropionase-like amidohydrolase
MKKKLINVIFCTFLLSSLLLCFDLYAEVDKVAIKGGTILTITNGTIRNGIIIIVDGKITTVGDKVEIPHSSTIIDATNKYIMPGMIDTHSHIGAGPYFGNDAWDVNEATDPVTPHVDIIDAINPNDPSFRESVKYGVTTIVTGPGSSNTIGGKSVVIKPIGRTIEEMILKKDGGMKIAMGAKGYGRRNMYPATTMGNTSLLRETLIATKEYMEKWQKYKKNNNNGPPPEKNLKYEALIPVLERELRVRAHIHTANDIMALLKIKDEFNFKLSFEHSTEAYKVAEEVAKRNVPCVMVPLFIQVGMSDDLYRAPALLAKAGVKIAFHTDHPVVHQKWIRYCAAICTRYGLSEEDALRAITINPAEIAEVDDRVGSIEKGKDADIVILSGHPFEIKSRVEKVLINGQVAFDKNKEELH